MEDKNIDHERRVGIKNLELSLCIVHINKDGIFFFFIERDLQLQMVRLPLIEPVVVVVAVAVVVERLF